MSLRPLNNTILFSFIDDSAGGMFISKTHSGILLSQVPKDFDAQRTPRWGRALAIGPKVNDVRIGDLILIEGLQWTEGFKYDEVRIWKTDEEKVMAITNDINNCVQY